MKLIIAEKPSVAREFVKIIESEFNEVFIQEEAYWESKNYIVSYAIGHLFTLANPEDYKPEWKEWNKDELPIIPNEFKIKKASGKSKHISVLKKLFKDKRVTHIINACDAGREGELIFAYIYQYSDVKKEIQRLWLSSLTKESIVKAFKSLKPGLEYYYLEQAARKRAEADWTVGINSTRAATIQLRDYVEGVVSVGRVQTPTLALIVNKTLEIKNFKPEKYQVVQGVFKTDKTESYLGGYEDYKRLDEKTAKGISIECEAVKTGTVSDVQEKTILEKAPLLFDLTSLQRAASQKFGFTAKRTLAAAQALYEKKLITYPRTDSRFLSTDMKEDYTKLLEKLKTSGYKSLNPSNNLIYDNSKVTDHHAIILTENGSNNLYSDEEKIYSLIKNRIISSSYPEAEAVRTKINTLVNNKFNFITKGKAYKNLGWREIEPAKEKLLPSVKKGDVVDISKIEVVEKETKPPPYYSDGTLLAAMETAGKDTDPELRELMKDSGLGTPATRASIIERLIKVKYIKRSKKSLVATDKGILIIRALKDHPLTSPELTGKWEKRLLEIERQEREGKDFSDDINKFSRIIVRNILSIDPGSLGIEKVKRETKKKASIGPCPKCGKPLFENKKAFSCWSSDDPGCGFSLWKEVSKKKLPPEVLKELLEKGETSEPVAGFKSKRGNSFSARLKVYYNKEAKKTIIGFNEDWAKRKQPAQ